MKKQFLKRAVSLTAAAALGVSSMAGSMTVSAVTADETKSLTDEVSTDLVPVIIQLKDNALLATSQGTKLGKKFLSTKSAAKLQKDIEKAQKELQKTIRRFYPKLNVKFSYSVLLNGFSCELPENLIDRVSRLSAVKSVSRDVEYYDPNMATAPDLSGYPAYYDYTGCSGEGQVVAVLDTELDLSHPMFSALDSSVDVAITKEDVEDVANGIGFNIRNVDPDKAYRSSKVPFALDYVDDDPYDAVSKSEMYPAAYHGTHVSGISAGNKFTDSEGNTVAGIARDAQLVFMAVASAEGSFSTSTFLAGFEDAVKLDVDVINMSFGAAGEAFNEDADFLTAFQNAEAAGVTVCISAGNDDNGMNGKLESHSPENPDTSTCNNIVPTGAGVLEVASADNQFRTELNAFSAGGEAFAYEGTYPTEDADSVVYLDDQLSGEYEFVICGQGTEADFANVDVAGKIAVVFPGKISKAYKSANAAKAGAAGAIVVLEEDRSPSKVLALGSIPAGAISYGDGMRLASLNTNRITFSKQKIPYDIATKVSAYTSWGVKQSLELRPDIMGVGGLVRSAAYGESTTTMNGTSMASPYVAGCSAVLSEYLDKYEPDIQDNEQKTRLMRNLMMTSAVPYKNGGMYVTPRRQGAGLVNLNNLINDKVLLTGEEGETKINLGAELGDSFSFDVNLSNIADEAVDFTSAKLVLTTDSTRLNGDGKEEIYGQRSLTCNADLSALKHMDEGEVRTETVSVTLDSAQTAEIRKTFTNGFFVEGYLVLGGADNCCDISIPLVGFAGDWENLPIINTEETAVVTDMSDQNAFAAGYSLAQLSELVEEVLPLIPEKELESGKVSFSELFEKYATDAQKKAFADAKTGEYYISPNNDGVADNIALGFNNYRYCHVDGLDIFTKRGIQIVPGAFNLAYPLRYMEYPVEPQLKIHLPDGTYTGKVSAYVNYGDSSENPDVYAFNFNVDTKAPVSDAKITKTGGKSILTVTASDKALDGIYIVGKKADTKDVSAESGLEKLVYAQSLLTKDYTLEVSNRLNLIRRDPSVLGKILKGTADESDLSGIDFADVIAAKADANGTFTAEYDVTGLESFTVSVMDKAYNVTVTESSDIAVTDNSDQEAADAVKELIDALPAPEDVTPADKEQIEEAREAYEALTPEQKELIDDETLQKLIADEEALAKAENDQAAADRVIALIDAIGPVTADHSTYAKISAAREAYDALTDEQKALVTNYDKLLAAEEAYSRLFENYKVVLTKVSSEKIGTMNVAWKNEGNADGYDILVWVGGRQTGNNPSNVLKFTAGSADSEVIISGLTPYARYYVKVRAYKIVDGKRVYSQYSDARNTVIKGYTYNFGGFGPGIRPQPGKPYPGNGFRSTPSLTSVNQKTAKVGFSNPYFTFRLK